MGLQTTEGDLQDFISSNWQASCLLKFSTCFFVPRRGCIPKRMLCAAILSSIHPTFTFLCPPHNTSSLDI